MALFSPTEAKYSWSFLLSWHNYCILTQTNTEDVSLLTLHGVTAIDRSLSTVKAPDVCSFIEAH